VRHAEDYWDFSLLSTSSMSAKKWDEVVILDEGGW